MHNIEPFYGWLKHYDPEADHRSPFYGVVHNAFFFDRQVHEYLAHPLWESIGSEGLLVKLLYVDYDRGFAVLEMFGVWNDLLENDFKLFIENCLSRMIQEGISRFVLVMENVLNIYLEADDYYQEITEMLGEGGWICLLRTREHVLRELSAYGIDAYFYWAEGLDELRWRKLKPWQLLTLIEGRLLLP